MPIANIYLTSGQTIRVQFTNMDRTQSLIAEWRKNFQDETATLTLNDRSNQPELSVRASTIAAIVREQ